MSDLAAFGIELDEDGKLVGFQAGKAAALLDWEHRKQAAQFLKLCKRLYWNAWSKRQRAENTELVRARGREQARLYKDTRRLYMLLYNRSRRKPFACVCKWCKAKFTVQRGNGLPRPRTASDPKRGPLPGAATPRRSNYCSLACRAKARASKKRESAEKKP